MVTRKLCFFLRLAHTCLCAVTITKVLDTSEKRSVDTYLDWCRFVCVCELFRLLVAHFGTSALVPRVLYSILLFSPPPLTSYSIFTHFPTSSHSHTSFILIHTWHTILKATPSISPTRIDSWPCMIYWVKSYHTLRSQWPCFTFRRPKVLNMSSTRNPKLRILFTARRIQHLLQTRPRAKNPTHILVWRKKVRRLPATLLMIKLLNMKWHLMWLFPYRETQATQTVPRVVISWILKIRRFAWENLPFNTTSNFRTCNDPTLGLLGSAYQTFTKMSFHLRALEKWRLFESKNIRLFKPSDSFIIFSWKNLFVFLTNLSINLIVIVHFCFCCPRHRGIQVHLPCTTHDAQQQTWSFQIPNLRQQKRGDEWEGLLLDYIYYLWIYNDMIY